MLQLNISDILLNENGIQGYHWPVSQSELYQLRELCLKTSNDFIKNHYKQDFENSRLLHITYIEIVRELITMIRSDMLNSRQNDTQIAFNPDNYPYLNGLQCNLDLSQIAARKLAYAAKTVPAPSKMIKTLRPFKLLLGHPVYKRKTLSSITDHDIVTFSTSSFMERHAQKIEAETGQKVTLCSLWEWYDFSHHNMSHFAPDDFKNSAFLSDYIAELKASIANYGYEISDSISKAITVFAHMINHYAKIYRDHLSAPKNIKKLPETLWFGSNNPIHPRVLRSVVQDNGGHTVAHDHGRSILAGISNGELGTVFDFCNEFVAYSKFLSDHASSMQKEILARTPTTKPVKFTSVSGAFLTSDDVQNYRAKIQPVTHKKQQKTAMFITGVFMGEGIAGLNVLPADVTLLDFQIQLISYLKSQGYKIILKTHPENRFPLPQALHDMDDVEIVGGYVEETLGDVDLICFDFLSSAFRSIAMSNKPMLFFHFGWADIPGDIRAELETRIGIVDGGYDNENRLDVEWSTISDTIKTAETRAQENTDLFLTRFYDMVDA